MWFAHGFPCPVEDQEDVLEAMRSDAVDEITEQLEGTGLRTRTPLTRRTATMRGRGVAQQSCAAWFRCCVPDLVSNAALFWIGAPTAADGVGGRRC